MSAVGAQKRAGNFEGGGNNCGEVAFVGYNTANMMKKILAATILLCLATCATAQTRKAGSRPEAKDLSTLRTTINGRMVEVPRTHENSSFICYDIREPFVEHDTTFLFRRYTVRKCDTCDLQKAGLVSSYYISFAKEKNHMEHVRTMTMTNQDGQPETDEPQSEEWVLDDTEIISNDLQDIPRVWYQLVKYNGRFYLSCERPAVIRFTENYIVNHYADGSWRSQLSEMKIKDKKNFSYKEDGLPCEIRASKVVKGLYVLTSTTPNGNIVKEALCPEESVKYFDLIDRCGESLGKMVFGDYQEIDFDML